MSAEVETMPYQGATPWHGLGHRVSGSMTPAQMLKVAGIDWTVSKQKLSIHDGQHKGKVVPDRYAIVRDTDGRFLTMVGKAYKPIQNADAMDFFRKFVEAGHMEMETAGSLRNGQYIWALAKLGANFKVGRNDRVEGYLLMACPHVFGKALIYQFTGIRAVCMNTFTLALGAHLRGGKSAFRISHSVVFNDDMKVKAEQALGLAKEQLDEFRQVAEILTKKKVKENTADTFFNNVIGFNAVKQQKRQDEGKAIPRLIERFKHAQDVAPGSQLETAKGTYWGLFNAVTYVVDHQMGTTRDLGLTGAWLGGAAGMKRRALELAIAA